MLLGSYRKLTWYLIWMAPSILAYANDVFLIGSDIGTIERNPSMFLYAYLFDWKLKYIKTIVWLIVLYGCEALSLTLREECKLRVFEKRVLRRIFGPKRNDMRSGEGSTMMNFIVCIVHLLWSGWFNLKD